MLASLFVDAFRFIPDHAGLLLDKSGELSELAFAALGIALLIALPLGLWLGHRHRGLFAALGVSSLGRALPSIALIGLFIAWLGVGFILAREQWLVRGGNLEQIDQAFFTMNSLVGLIIFSGHFIEWLLIRFSGTA